MVLTRFPKHVSSQNDGKHASDGEQTPLAHFYMLQIEKKICAGEGWNQIIDNFFFIGQFQRRLSNVKKSKKHDGLD